jgi:hypothetical protein
VTLLVQVHNAKYLCRVMRNLKFDHHSLRLRLALPKKTYASLPDSANSKALPTLRLHPRRPNLPFCVRRGASLGAAAMVAQEEPKREMSQYAKEQISVHSAMVTYISMTALITLCPAFVLFLYAAPPWLPLSPSMLLATSPNA